MRFDMHVHTAISPCSTLAIGDLLAQARQRGLNGVCITDHNTMEAGRLIREGVQTDGLVVIIGMEYDTPEGDFLLFGPLEDLQPGLSAQMILETVMRRSGAAVAAHPFRSGRSTDGPLLCSGLVGSIEAVNGRNKAAENAQAFALARQKSFTLCGGSDAHSLEELGGAATWFDVPVFSCADLVQALNRGVCRPADATGRKPMTAQPF